MNQFLDPVAFAIVLGGTALAALLRSPLADVGRAIGALRTLGGRRFAAAPLVTQVTALGRIARRHGVMTLDRSVIADADVAAAIAAIVDGAAPDDVAALVAARRRARSERHAAAIDVWTGAAEAAPAMGLVGTLIGLAKMFGAITDPAAIGGAMGIALLATLYGAVLANFVLMPIAGRLRAAARVEAGERIALDAPLIALAEREQPRGSPLASSVASAA